MSLPSAPVGVRISDGFSSGSHAYYDIVTARADVVAAYSLRDQAQIERYRARKLIPSAVTYDPANDSDSRRQDAAKLVTWADVVSMRTPLRLPIPHNPTQSLFVTWDNWMGAEFAFAHTAISTYKHFQFTSGRIWTEVRSRFKLAAEHRPPAVALVDLRMYVQEESLGPGTGAGATFNGVGYGGAVPTPMVGEFDVQAEVWTRYFAFFVPAGDWFVFSLWVADEDRAPVAIFRDLLIGPNRSSGVDFWDTFWVQFNTSATTIPEGRGELVAYARNVVMLAGVSDPTPLLVRPVA